MKLVYCAENLFWLQLVKNTLDFAGIDCEVRNQYAAGAMGDLGYLGCWPELWVPAQEFDRSQAIIQQLLKSPASNQELPCPHCASPCPAHFERCWQCQSLLS